MKYELVLHIYVSCNREQKKNRLFMSKKELSTYKWDGWVALGTETHKEAKLRISEPGLLLGYFQEGMLDSKRI
jgi:hypothetical protein